MHHTDLLSGIAIGVVVATALSFIAKAIRLPFIIAYIAAGILIGPQIGFGWIQSEEEIESISEIGLILLLFIIGLEIDLKKLLRAGKAVVLTGLFQVPISFVVGWLLLTALGFSNSDGKFEMMYLSFGISLSSTMIVVKALYEKHELDTLAGRITLGILVFQDIWAIVFLAIQPNFLSPEVAGLLGSFAKGAGLVALCLLLSKFALPKIFDAIAKLPEFMLVASLAWCFLVCGLATFAGLSKEMGALIAGISISTFPYNLDVVAKVINIRDFFITLFLVALGMKVPMPTAEILMAALLLSLVLVVTRLFSIFPILYGLKLGNRISMITTINLAQISEFSLVIASLGLSYGHIGSQTVAFIVFTLVITAVLSTYLIQSSHTVFSWLNKLLPAIGFKEVHLEEDSTEEFEKTIFILGFFKLASSLIHEIEQAGGALKERIRVIDFNPEVIRKLKAKGFDAQYGDIAHIETLHHLGIHHAEVVISTVPDSLLKGTSNLNILKAVRQHAPHAKTLVVSEDIQSTVQLYEAGADYVIVPRVKLAPQLLEVVEQASSWTKPGVETRRYLEFKTREEILP
jgi:Kef-type K+ transport system membrane component KefB